ncbi:degenerin deg-1-like [Acanthaster planci]|uniref:Degenerin deg-1-like n=1 Tax=Acanthaster planci TaxID=133434 RepID=A0A8B7ZN99_ACAPL|nr:degenerin deg-1-like [Acanthaster planci]
MEYGTTVVEGQRLTRRVLVTGSLDYLQRTGEEDKLSKEKKRGALRQAVTTFADTTTAHGLPLIINGTYTVSRIAWSVIWLIAFGLAILQSTLLLVEYFQVRPLTTTIELITKTNLDFPAVTVCNMNRMRRSKLVGTRFEGLIAIDGGVQGEDYDYSWFFDWSSLEWFDRWDSRGEPSSSPDGNSLQDSSPVNSEPDDSTAGGIGSSESIPGVGGESDVTPQGSGGATVGGSSVDGTDGSDSVRGAGDDDDGMSSDTSTSGPSHVASNGEGDNPSTAGDSIDEMSSIDNESSLPGGSSNTPSHDVEKEEASSTAPPHSLNTHASTSSGIFPVTQVNSPDSSSSQTTTDPPGSETVAPGQERDSDGASSSFNPGEESDTSILDSERRRRSVSSRQERQRRTLSSSTEDFWWESDDFEYDSYYNWDGVTDENDWRGFYDRSTADDFSDLIDIANPTREELEVLGHQAQDFILQCTFDKRNCSYRDFRVFQNTDYGNCFTFNHGTGNSKVRTTSRFGAKYGLHVTLFIEQPEYLGIFSPESGVRLTVHGQRTMPLPEDNGITAAAGLATSVGMRQDFISRQPFPYGNCSDSFDTRFNVTAGDYDYSLSACTKFCLQSEMLSRCGCVTDILIYSALKCSYLNTTQQTCRRAVENLYEDNKLQSCKCFSACRETTFKLGVSSSRWPSERYEEHLYSRISATNEKAARLMQEVEQTRKNLVRLRVYFEELNYQSIIQTPKYSVETLLGSLGGLFGLFIGFSVITIFEVVLFLLKLLKIFFFWGQPCHRREIKPVIS